MFRFLLYIVFGAFRAENHSCLHTQLPCSCMRSCISVNLHLVGATDEERASSANFIKYKQTATFFSLCQRKQSRDEFALKLMMLTFIRCYDCPPRSCCLLWAHFTDWTFFSWVKKLLQYFGIFKHWYLYFYLKSVLLPPLKMRQIIFKEMLLSMEAVYLKQQYLKSQQIPAELKAHFLPLVGDVGVTDWDVRLNRF